MSKFKEYLKTMDKRKKYAGISAIGVVTFAVVGFGIYNIMSSKAANTDNVPKRELIIQQEAEKVNKYTGDKNDFHFNKYWSDRSGGIYTINESNDVTNVEYKKNMGNEWTYMAAPVEGNFSDFKYINLKVTGDKGKKLFLKLEESAVELKAKFFTLNGKEQILTLDISDVKNKKKLDALKEVMLFASPGEVQDGSFKILDAWFSMESPTVNRYIGDKKDFHFNKYWEDIFNHGIAIDEENETTTMTFTKPKDNNWILASTAVEGKLSDFNYATMKVKGEAGQKFLLKLEKGDTVYGEKLVELSGEEEVVIVKLNKDDMEGLDSLKEVRVFPNAGEPESGKLDILDAWFSVEKPEGFKEAGEATPSGANSEYINGWKIEEWTKYVGENINGLTKVSYNNPEPWAYVTYNVEGKISGNNLLNIYLNSNGCDHVMIKLRGKFKYVDPVGGYNVYDEVEVFSDKIKQGETNLQVDITDAVKELGHVVEVVMFVESSQNVKDVDRVGSLIFGAPKFTEGQASGNTTSSNKWLVEDWTGYTSEIKEGFTRISYNNPAPWANISYNIKNLLKDNDFLELKLNSNGCDHVQIKLRGKYLNSDPGYKVYQEALVFDGKLSNGERTLKLDLREAIEELGRENITDIMLFIESNQLVEGLDRKGSLDIYTPVFKKAAESNPENPENPEEPSVGTDNKWVVDEWTGYTAEIKDGFTRISYDNPAEWANISLNIKNLLKDNDVLSLKLNSNGADHIQLKLRGKYLNSDPGYKVYEELLIFDGKLKNGEQTLNINLKDFIKELGRENITDIIMFVESSQAVDGLDRKGSLDIYTPVFNKNTETTPETPVDPGTPQEPVVSGKWEVGEWTGYKAEIKDGFTRIKYDNVQSWASITYNIKDMLKDNTTLNLKLNSDGADSVLIKIRGKYLNSTPGYAVYEEEEVFNEQIKSGEKTLKLNLKEVIKKLGRENITDIVMFIESNEIKGLDKKGSLDIYTPVFNKDVVTDPTPEQPVDPEDPQEPVVSSEWEVGEWTGYKAEIKDGFTRIKYDNVQSWASITYNIKNMLKDNTTLNLKLNSDGCDSVLVKIRGKYLNSDKGYAEYEEEVVSDEKLSSGERILKIDLKKAIEKLGRENITDIVMFIESNDIDGLDKKGSLDIYTPIFNKEVVTNPAPNPEPDPELPQEPQEPVITGKWEVAEWTGYKAEIMDGFTRIKYDNVQSWASITYNIKNMLKDNTTLNLKLNSDGCDSVLIKIRGKYLNSDKGYAEYEEAEVFSEQINSGEKTLKVDLNEAIKKLGAENITDIVMFIESNDIKGLDKKGSLDIYTPIFNKEVVTNPAPNPEPDPELPQEPQEPVITGKWEVAEWTGYKAEIMDGFTRIKYDNVQSWASITYKIKDMLKDNTTLNLKLNSDGCDSVLIKIRGKYLNSDKGYAEYEEEVVSDEKLSSGERILKIDLKKAIEKLGRENITDIVMFVESNDVKGVDKKGSLDIYTPVFNKDVVIDPTPEQPQEPVVSSEWIVEQWTGYKAEIMDGFTRIKYDELKPWVSITYDIKSMLKDNTTLNLKLNSDGCDYVLIKIRGKYLNSDKGYAEYEEEVMFDEIITNGEKNIQKDLTKAIDKLGRENITDIVMFIESNTDKGLDGKGSLDIYTPVFNKDVVIDPTPEQPQEPVVSSEWIVEEWTGYKAEIMDGFTRIKYDNLQPWVSITYNIEEMLKDNTTLNLKLNSDGCEYVLIKIRGKYLNSDKGYAVYEEEVVFDEIITNGERVLKLDLNEVINKLGLENITDIVMFIESNTDKGLDGKGSLDIYTPVFNKDVVIN